MSVGAGRSSDIEITAFRWVPPLRNLRHTQLVAEHPALAAYVARGEQRPAFQRALADQLAVFEQHQPEGAAA